MNKNFFRDKNILITGGAGFVGSNLAHRLVELAAKNITIIDCFHPDYGGNIHNLVGIESKINLIRENILNREVLNSAIDSADLVFHIAAQCSHVDSMIDPLFDLEYNAKASLCLLEAAKASSKKPAIIYAGTRAINGAPLEIPVTEFSLPNPTDIYGVNKHAAELYGAVYARVHGIPFVSMRMTNSYGPRHQMKNGKYGILNWFLSLALQEKPIKIYGTGEQLRDYIYIDDAVDAFLRAAQFASDLRDEKNRIHEKVQVSGLKVPYAVFNLSSGKSMKFVDCVRKITDQAGIKLEFIPWPKDRAAIETGDFVADPRVTMECLDWNPSTGFDVGLKKTFDFYKINLKHYL